MSVIPQPCIRRFGVTTGRSSLVATLALLVTLALTGSAAWAQAPADEAPGDGLASPAMPEAEPDAPGVDGAPTPAAALDAAAADPAPATVGDWLDATLKPITDAIFATLFFDVTFGAFGGASLPLVVAVLGLGAIFFTLWHGFINLRGFGHALAITRGRYTTDDDPGDIPPFRALTSALSATVGLGNIAGVALAVQAGGPGAIFWMMFLGFFGMSSKFHEATLGQMYRRTNPDGTVSGGAMYYLDHGIGSMGPAMKPIGKVLGVIFAVFCIGGAVGGGNMFQANQAFEGFYSAFLAPPVLAETARPGLTPGEIESLRGLLTESQLNRLGRALEMPIDAEADREAVRAAVDAATIQRIATHSQIDTLLDGQAVAADQQNRQDQRARASLGFGILLAGVVAVVVIGGITRIGAATSRIVPSMCLLYVLGCLVVILVNIGEVPSHVALILADAFAWESAWGGLIGVMVIGFTRAAFSSEAGLGSSAIAHSAAKTNEPVREGLVASLEPFIDTIVICFMTAMVVLITDAYVAPELAEVKSGAAVTLFAFQQTGPLAGWFPYVLSISIVLFAFSTMIAWGYYGEQAWGYLFGMKSVLIFRLVFVACVFIGTVASLGPVLNFSDAMLLSMAFPNIIGGVILAPKVKARLKDYWARYKAGEMRPDVKSHTGATDGAEI